MKLNYKFSNLCGTVYRSGNVLFTPDGNSLVSPVGNRVSVFDLVSNKSFTMPFENRKNIVRMALSPNATLLITVDEDGRALLINFPKQVVLHHHNFSAPVRDISFSPDGRFIAVTHGKHIQIWRAPGFTVEFAPFVLHRTLPGHFDDVVALAWSHDSRLLATGSKDTTCRVYSVRTGDKFSGAVLSGHSESVVGVWFSSDAKSLYSVSRDGALFEWRFANYVDRQTVHDGDLDMDDQDKEDQENANGDNVDDEEEEDADRGNDGEPANKRSKVERSHRKNGGRRVRRWKSTQRHYFKQNNARVISATFHAASGLLSVGFDSGIFGIWELPDFTNIQTLSISQHRITTVAVNPSGEWLAFGSSKLGQLLVWEWQSESYVLKQQGHEHDMNTIAYSPDGQFIATGGADAKVKLWNAQSGFCFVTFTEHTGGITAIEFARRGQVVYTASLDGTVRAFDLVRYRNFRTMTTPTPVQFASVSVDPSGEIVCAGTMDTFEVYVWSVQTGRLLEILPGHEGPVSALAFVPENAGGSGGTLASASWDKTVRLWDVFARDKQLEVFDHQSEVLALAFMPDGCHIVTSTLNGQICFWNAELAKQIGSIECRRDISGGRSVHDQTTAANSAANKSFSSLCVSPDGSVVIAGGNSKYVCIYDVASRQLVRKFQISHNMSFDAMSEFLSTKDLTEAGPNQLIDTSGDCSDLEDRLDRSLPGVQSGDKSLRKTVRPRARTQCVRFSPAASSWAAATTEGLLIFSLDDTITFDPFDLDMDITPDAVRSHIANQAYLHAIVTACRLGEHELLRLAYMSVQSDDIPLVVRSIPHKHIDRLIRLIVTLMDACDPRIEFHLTWITSMVKTHGAFLRNRVNTYASALRGLAKVVGKSRDDLAKVCSTNTYLISYLVDQVDTSARALAQQQDAEDQSASLRNDDCDANVALSRDRIMAAMEL